MNLDAVEVGTIRSLLQAIGSEFQLDFIVLISQRDGQADVLSASKNSQASAVCEELKDLISGAITKQGIPVVNEDNVDGRAN